MKMEETIVQVPIEDIIPNRFQPRLTFDERGLEDLANSIRQHGIIQPLVLRRVSDKYEIIAGERRYKAANLVGLKTVPAVITEMDDHKSAEVAIVENVQRRDLTAIEEARSYKNLLDQGYLTQAELAKKMGLSQSAIANKLRLLNLDEEVQQALLANQISERHARSLLVLEKPEDQKKWLNKIINERMTVRDLDEALKKENQSQEPSAQVESDIPLIKPLDIEEIKNKATELPDINPTSDIARRLQEIEQEKQFNPDIVPVEQATNDSKNNYFNFLENETVNMNTTDQDLKIPSLNMNFSNKKEDEEVPNIDIKDDVQDISEETPAKIPELNLNFGNPSVELQEESNDEVFDPVNLIERLDPKYDEKIEEKLGLDLKTAINTIREAKDSLSDRGFSISLEETDLADIYQFIIKIKKD